MKRLLLTLLPLALAACASTPPANKDASLASADKDTICDRETRTGSMLLQTKCRTAEQREAERRAVQDVEANTRNIRAGQTGKAGS